MIQVITTCATLSDAEDLATLILDTRLAFCIHIDEVKSLYIWEGEVKNHMEWRLVIKSFNDYYQDLESFIIQNHKYQIPQVTMNLIKRSSEDFSNWALSTKGNISLN